jgi:hypothetical protein
MARLTGRHDRVEKGPSLAKGPVALLGTALLAYGLIGLIVANSFKTGNVPSGIVQGKSWLGPEVNGWSNFFHIALGGLLLFGALQHLLARTMALIVGLIFGAASVIALFDGSDVFAIMPANGWTKLLWGALSVALLIMSLLPRIRRRKPAPETGAAAPAGRDREAAAPRAERERERIVTEPRRPAGAQREERVTSEREVVAPADGDGPADHGRHDPDGFTEEPPLREADGPSGRLRRPSDR